MQQAIIQGAHIFQKANTASLFDVATGQNLRDTLRANRGAAVGLAANMIGQNKRIIAFFDDNGQIQVMYNPEITAKNDTYSAQEGCLSLLGERSVTRYQAITVTWQDAQFVSHGADFSGYTAEIIQHEIDHLNGIII